MSLDSKADFWNCSHISSQFCNRVMNFLQQFWWGMSEQLHFGTHTLFCSGGGRYFTTVAPCLKISCVQTHLTIPGVDVKKTVAGNSPRNWTVFALFFPQRTNIQISSQIPPDYQLPTAMVLCSVVNVHTVSVFQEIFSAAVLSSQVVLHQKKPTELTAYVKKVFFSFSLFHVSPVFV